ncbi:DUF397 domain-containing protein [Micromonospora sp. NBS 11-29]|uniref:DUF397 domain-containing protein n=1 Tax=Micromonospora sp. NBS 11-29 TaxID=1960879 RepID=UPI000B78B360|nr:DUF397 domain-containing protein [Micromonospora sp. NBS 11-29]
MAPSDPVPVSWRKSSRSGANDSNCVEVADLSHALAVRDSKDPGGPLLLFDRAAWSRFIVGLRRG